MLSLVETLPEGSEFHASVAGGREFRPWDTKTHLLANIFNAVNTGTLVLSNAPKSMRQKFRPITGPETPQKKQAQNGLMSFLKRFDII